MNLGVTITVGLTLLALLVMPGVSAADQWPQFRGPQAGAVADDPALPDTWSETENIVWRLDIPARAPQGVGDRAGARIVGAEPAHLRVIGQPHGRLVVLDQRRAVISNLRLGAIDAGSEHQQERQQQREVKDGLLYNHGKLASMQVDNRFGDIPIHADVCDRLGDAK